MAHAGDRCVSCKSGRLATRTSKRDGDHQIRYLKCPKCGAQSISVVAAERSWRRDKKVV